MTQKPQFSTIYIRYIAAVLLLVMNFGVARAQTNEFTYQGKLNDSSSAANGSYDFQFELHNSSTSTTPLATITRSAVTVTNGVFTVNLDFAANLYDGNDRFLKISVKPAGSPNPFTPLAPYQRITSAPYAIKSLNSQNATNSVNADLAADSSRLGGVAANQFVQTSDSRLTDARNPLPNSANYVQNTTAPQVSSNFNVSGTGTANVFDAATAYNIGGSRAFTAVGGVVQNVFAGINAGTTNTTGFGNTFVGNFAGNANSTGNNNSFFGTDAGRSSTADGNSFFGRSAGFATTTGTSNTFFGLDSGRFNVSGSTNAFFGRESGFNNTADANSFFGYRSGYANNIGTKNSFFGNGAGQANTSGGFNSFFGDQAGGASNGASNSFFGSGAGLSNDLGSSNSFFGSIAGFNNTSGDFNTFYGGLAGFSNTLGDNNTALGYSADVGANLNHATAIGSDSSVSTSNTIAIGRANGVDSVLIYGLLRINSLGSAGATALCRNASNQIATCSSSLRYKTDVRNFSGGLELLRRFRPVTFAWKADGRQDIGFVAEEVDEIEPLLATRNADGQIEGVKYAQITTVLVNSVNEQQSQIEKLQKIIEIQQDQLIALRKLICSGNQTADICKEQ